MKCLLVYSSGAHPSPLRIGWSQLVSTLPTISPVPPPPPIPGIVLYWHSLPLSPLPPPPSFTHPYPNLKSMAYLLLLAYCSTYIWSLPLFNLCVIHSYRAKNKVWSVYTTYLNILATESHWQPDNVSLLVGMPTRNKKCGSLHGANRLGARWQALECSGKLEKMLVFLAGKVSLHVVVSCAAPAASLVH